MVDALGDEPRPLGAHERRLKKLFGDAFPRASVPMPRGFFPLPVDPQLANLVTQVQDRLTANLTECFKDYENLLELAEQILAGGLHYPTSINLLAIKFALRHDPQDLQRQGAELLSLIVGHMNGQPPDQLLALDGAIEIEHLVHYACRLQNNLAGYAYAAGDLEAARECLANVIALQELDPSTPELVKIDRRYSLAGVLLEEAFHHFEKSLLADQALGAGRFAENADDHPLLHAMMAVFVSRTPGGRSK